MQAGQGILLNRASYDSRKHPVIDLWLATATGPVRLWIDDQQPLLFIASAQLEAAQNALHSLVWHAQSLQHQTFDHQSVTGLYFSSLEHFYRARDQLEHAGIIHFEADVRLHERYLMERFAYAMVEFYGSPSYKDGYTQYHQVKLRGIDAPIPDLKVLSFDLECSRHGELYSIGLSGCGCAKVLMIGSPTPAATEIEWVSDEKMLISRLIDCVQQLDPDLLIGWNVVQFDCQLLAKRAQINRLELRLGRGKTLARFKEGTQSRQGSFIIPGRVVIDGIDALKTATYSFDSFSLESVSQALLGRGKLTEDPDHRMAEIEHNFHYDKPTLAAYNLEDCQLVEAIFSHTHLIEFLALRSQLTGLELDRQGGSVAAFSNLYMPKLHRANYIAPNLPADGGLASPGGYVMDSKPGLYQNVLVLDFKSLYPSIIRTFKIDPMGLIEGLAKPDNAIDGFLGAKFSRTQHFLPAIIGDLWHQRDIAKQHQDKPRSQAIKIIMNSFYGVLGSGGCRFYDQRLASSITMRGHQIMQQTAQWIRDAGFDVIYGDTDSTFVLLGEGFTPSQAQATGQQLQDEINAKWQAQIQQQFTLECTLEIEFETHYQRFHMPTIRGSQAGSKKRYAGITPQGQIVFKGLENVRSDWTELAKHFQSQLYQLVFAEQNPSEMIRTLVEETRHGIRDNQLIYRKRLRRDLDEYSKNIPPQVRAARDADARNQALGKSLRYQNRGWIQYVITVNGPQALEYHEAPIDYQHYIDKQLKPVADALLPLVGLDFDAIISAQLGLF
ncbi:DNA polymerase II [Celerinatantimonas diazotrophica]|uniref:DNA polymerase n=1 Tax=Celerinatantimonas diazotrophica TaxID=412034 RepID=A0A4V2PRV7_9GAMM|nr:DNA polymerase II [Celerinatantimonas diazotrophica]TCK60341.1 DNA damage-inducible DNA polymerase II [Celerinatantimonas diazotrophica]CAG9295101.1 DNA polymerase II [Celerinatantimonas diazotrophica]